MFPLTAGGQQSWSLQDCIKYAWDNNIQIKQQQILSEQNRNNLLQSQYNYLPSLSGSVSHSMNWGRSVNMQDLQIIQNKLSQSSSLSFRASTDIFNGFQKKYNIENKKLVYEISIQDESQLKNNISIEISRAYLQILLSREILKTAEESYDNINKQVERTKKFVDAGSQAMGALLEIEAQLATERVAVVSAQNQLRTNILTLKQMLDLPDETSFEIAVPEINIDNKIYKGENIYDLYSESLDLPQIESAKLNTENSKVQLKMAKGQLLPSLSLSAGYGTYFADSRSDAFFTQLRDNRNPSIGFSLSIPIFNSLSAKTNVKNAELGVKNAELNLRSKEHALYKEIQQAVNDAVSLYEKYLASQQNVKALEESFRYVQEKFNLGTVSATDFTIARTNLNKAKSEFYQAKYQYVFQLKVIDFYKGIKIEL
jgi:outer membrane protein